MILKRAQCCLSPPPVLTTATTYVQWPCNYFSHLASSWSRTSRSSLGPATFLAFWYLVGSMRTCCWSKFSVQLVVSSLSHRAAAKTRLSALPRLTVMENSTLMSSPPYSNFGTVYRNIYIPLPRLKKCSEKPSSISIGLDMS